MDLFQVLWDAFSLGERTIQELITISSYIDFEKRTSGVLSNNTNELSQIASVVVALMNEKSTSSIGGQLYDTINDNIVNMNFHLMDSAQGKELYERLKAKSVPGTYKIRKTKTGCKFDLVSSNGEVLTTSEIYSKIDSCVNGIESLKRYANSEIEDQTIENYSYIRNPKYELYTDKAGEFRFRLKSLNGQILAVSEGYKTKESCLATIEKVKSSANSNDIEKL